MNKFKISYTDHFSAAHRLPFYDGKCANIHGHNWLVTVVLKATELSDNRNCFIVDFKWLKNTVKEVIKKYDHKFLIYYRDPYFDFFRKSPFLTSIESLWLVPSCENLAQNFAILITEKITAENLTTVKSKEVTVEKAPLQHATFLLNTNLSLK